MLLAVMVLLMVNNGGSVTDVIGGDGRSDGRVKIIVVMIIKWPPGLTDYFFLVLLASVARLFKCRRFFFLVCVCAKMGSWSQAFLAKTMETALRGHGFKSC